MKIVKIATIKSVPQLILTIADTVKHHGPDYIVQYGKSYPPTISCMLYCEETV